MSDPPMEAVSASSNDESTIVATTPLPPASAVQYSYIATTSQAMQAIMGTSSQPLFYATTTNPMQIVASGNASQSSVYYQVPVMYAPRNPTPIHRVIHLVRPSTSFIRPISFSSQSSVNRCPAPPRRIFRPVGPSPLRSPVKSIVSLNNVPMGSQSIRVIQPARYNAQPTVPRPLKPRMVSKVSEPTPVSPIRPKVNGTSMPKPTTTSSNAVETTSIIENPVCNKQTFPKRNSKVTIIPNVKPTVLKKVKPVKPVLPPAIQNGTKKPSKFIDLRVCFPIDVNLSVRTTPIDWRRYRQDYKTIVTDLKKFNPTEISKVKKPWDKSYHPPMPPYRSPPKPKATLNQVKAYHLTANLPMNNTVGPLAESNRYASPQRKRKSLPLASTTISPKRTKTLPSFSTPNNNGKSASTESVRSNGSDSGVETSSLMSGTSGSISVERVVPENGLSMEPCSSMASTSAYPSLDEIKASVIEVATMNTSNRGLRKKESLKVEFDAELTPVQSTSRLSSRNYYKRTGLFKQRSKVAEWKLTVSNFNYDAEELVYMHIVFNKFYDEGLLPFMDEPYREAGKAAFIPNFHDAPVPSKPPKMAVGHYFRQRIKMLQTPLVYVDSRSLKVLEFIDDDINNLMPNASGCARTEPFRRRDPRFSLPDVTSVLEDGRRFIEVTKEDEDNIRQARECKKNDRRMTRHILTQIQNEAPELAKLQIFKSSSLANEKLLKYSKSPIHGYGLFALVAIEPEQIIIEYVGEQVRHEVADFREKRYESQGMNSSYMFRLDDEYVIDATKMGNHARFINHCCNPNCYARTSSRNGKKHILIYSKRYIDKGEELTYDYKFPLEDCKIPCHCGAKNCRKFLN